MSVVIVTGSAGLVGSSVCRLFASCGWDVVGVDNGMRSKFFGPDGSTGASQAKLRADLKNYKHEYVDICDYEKIIDLFSRYGFAVGAVVHTAAQPSHDWAAKEPHTDFRVNAVGTLNMLEATRYFCPSAAFVFTSTNKVYGDFPNNIPLCESQLNPMRFSINRDVLYEARFLSDHGINEQMPIDQSTHSLFGVSKAAADLMVQEYGRYFGMNTVCFRGGCLTGPAHAGVPQHGFLSYLVKCAVTGTPYKVIGYGGKQVRDNIHASDLANAFMAYVRDPKPGAVYNIGGGPERSCSVLEAITLAEDVTGREMIWELEDTPRAGDHKWWVTDTRKFERDYPDWKQKYTLRQTVEEIADGHAGKTA